MTHAEKHPSSGDTVQVRFVGAGHEQIPASKDGPVDFVIEDWWDHLTGGSWMFAEGNPAAIVYAIRGGLNGLPLDDDVVYGKVDGRGHLAHVSEIVSDMVVAG